MKKKLNEIFDEAKPQELDQFSDELNAPELSDEGLASVKGKVYAKTKLKKDRKNTNGIWLRFGAIAACFLLIVSIILAVPMLREDDPGVIPGPLDSNNSQSDAPLGSNNSQSDEPLDSNNPPIDVNHIILGIDPTSEPMSQYAISVEIPEKFTLSETYVPISVSYGLLDGTDVNRDSYTDIILKAENKNGHKVILDTLNIEEILKSDYTVKRIWDDNQEWVVGFDYSYTESHTLPLSLFSGDSGQVYISLDECNSADLGGLLGAGAYIVLYYTCNESSISISAEPIR